MDWGREITGRDKLGYLDSLHIIKTIFLQEDSKLYGIVLPSEYKVSLKHLADILRISKKKASRLKLSEVYPYLQKPHSMTPFIAERDLDLVDRIVFSDEIIKGEVDFSYPGKMDLSLQMQYQDAFDILDERYPEIIRFGRVH